MRHRRGLGAALLVLVALVDVVLAVVPPSPLVLYGLLDETAHAATAGLLLLCLTPYLSTVRPALALLTVVLVDVDHVPGVVFGSDVLNAGAPRPYTHSLVLVLVLLLVAAALPRRWTPVPASIAAGVALHLVRDLATGPGIPLLWPVSADAVQVPYVVYAAVLVAAAVWVSFGSVARRRGREPE